MKHAHAVLLVLGCMAMCTAFGCGPPRPNYTILHINRTSKEIGPVQLTHTDGSYYVVSADHGTLPPEDGSAGHSGISLEVPEEALLKWTDGDGVQRQRILKLREAVIGKLDLTSGEGEIHICFNEDGTISVVLVHNNRRALNYDEAETIIAEYTQDEISYPAP